MNGTQEEAIEARIAQIRLEAEARKRRRNLLLHLRVVSQVSRSVLCLRLSSRIRSYVIRMH